MLRKGETLLIAQQVGCPDDEHSWRCGVQHGGLGAIRLGVFDTERHRPGVGSVESTEKVIVADCLSRADWKQLLPSRVAVRSWVLPGNTADVATVERVKADLKGWKLGRCVFVADAGMNSPARAVR